MNSTKVRIVGAVAAATLALTGCGTPDQDVEPPAAAGAAPAAASGAEGDAAAGPLNFEDDGYACSLLTRADLEALFKGPVADEPGPKDVGVLRTCAWAEANNNSLLDLSIDKPSGGASREYDGLWQLYGVSHPAGSDPAEEVAGLGDKAYSYHHRGETHVKVLVGDKFVTVAVMYVLGKRTLTPEADVARVVTLAKQVLGRM
ncbi:hypothetical protein [Actinoplanes sp. NPDC049118]|uniref:hypothetical protein n=1 Tax=Actinoplanes sp. NPDC049118 TaxID=3155769 RepID=UPI0033DEFBFA